MLQKNIYICTRCNYIGKPKTVIKKGSSFIEFFLWFLSLCVFIFLIFALFYSLWRLKSKGKVCANCFHDELVPINSGYGKRLIQTLRSQRNQNYRDLEKNSRNF